ncbi:lecithin retinol acyltransferase family protein [Roseivirga sp. BDSF3-8]|uniref:lecithin retinol acyltransferase family protein n=1 Tax=Roseivirga sp. BDSF3-8 TaxID=3241598 RepID=UPI003531F807
MHPFVRKYQLQPADSLVVAKKFNPLISHYAVYLGCNDEGTALIMEAYPGAGVRLMPLSRFAKIYPRIRRVERFSGTEQERSARLRQAMRKVGRPYHLLKNNCEHLVTQVQTGKSRSRQVRRAITAAAVFSLLSR